METPSQILSQRIVERLQKEGLLSAEAGKKALAGLGEGKLRAEDWRLLLEKIDNKEGKK